MKTNQLNAILSKTIDSKFCGHLFELLSGNELNNTGMSIVISDTPVENTQGHLHTIQTEYYVVIEGSLELLLSLDGKEIQKLILKKNETVIIPPNTHHKIVSSTIDSKFIAISQPKWSAETEFLSAILN